MVSSKFTGETQFVEYWATEDTSKRDMADAVGKAIADRIVEEDSFTIHGDYTHVIIGVVMKDKI